MTPRLDAAILSATARFVVRSAKDVDGHAEVG
jgi:hypothetical protein